MNALLVTAFIGLILAGLFVALFLYHLETRRFSSNERESLMPLQTERSLPAKKDGNRSTKEGPPSDSKKP